MKTKLDYALQHASQGFRVFPLVPNGKTPLIKNWPRLATTDETQIRKWWKDNPNANIGIATGRTLIVLDFDCKDGKKGLISYAILKAEGDLPDTYEVTTPTGGKHVYLRIESGNGRTSDITVSVEGSDEFPELDIRCNGGYVVAVGSCTKGGSYDGNLLKIEQSSSEIIDIARNTCGRRAAVASTSQPLCELDTVHSRSRAVFLQENAQSAVEGAGGDQATYEVAARVRESGLSEAAALDLMLEHWNENQSPPWPPDELATKIEHAYRYATGAWGGASADAEFEPVEIGPRMNGLDVGGASAANGRSKITGAWARDAAAKAFTQPLNPLIKGLINRYSSSLVYGPTNIGKSFIALDMAFCIAAGIPWFGRPVVQGHVLFIAAEGGQGTNRRIAALCQHYGVPDCPLMLVAEPVDLLHRGGDVKAVIDLTKGSAGDWGLEPALVVIDTVSRALGGGDENSPVDMGAFVKNVDLIGDETGAAMLMVHHTGKDTSRGARGHSLLKAAVDTEIEVTAEHQIIVTKQRDMDYAKGIGFALKVLHLGKNVEGESLTSCVVEQTTASEFQPIELTHEESEYYDAAEDAWERKDDDATFIRREDWLSEMWVLFGPKQGQKQEPLPAKISARTLGKYTGISHVCISKNVRIVRDKGWVQEDKPNQYVIPNRKNT